jgi:hypothetical protein
MSGAHLARAVAVLCDTRPDLDAKLSAVLVKWVRDNVGKGATLDTLRGIQRSNGKEVIRAYLDMLTTDELTKLIKKLDRHDRDAATDTSATMKAHLQAIIGGHRDPAKPRVVQPTPPLPIADILKLSDSVVRRSELQRLTASQIKKAIKEKSIDAEQLGPRATKVEMIAHIESALQSGWPMARSVIDDTKY